ncbi:MAG: hypothetical protein KDA85_22610, partial [Planctomycetaceae bacterium]|nr:hypothetical protein [Planctomycetaceae bacterium]
PSDFVVRNTSHRGRDRGNFPTPLWSGLRRLIELRNIFPGNSLQNTGIIRIRRVQRLRQHDAAEKPERSAAECLATTSVKSTDRGRTLRFEDHPANGKRCHP